MRYATPKAAHYIRIANEPGISELLDPNAPIDLNLVQQVMRETQFPGLKVIPSGAPVDNIPYLLNSGRLTQLLRIFRDQFDMIIFDSPPIMFSPDARILGNNSDGVLMVVRAGKTSSSIAQAARNTLAHDGIPMIGTVLNDWQPSESKSYNAYRKYYN